MVHRSGYLEGNNPPQSKCESLGAEATDFLPYTN
jgi:hypothetical protein